ncbi:hypothetical protein TKK_0012363 [Trichogramma kaykai]
MYYPPNYDPQYSELPATNIAPSRTPSILIEKQQHTLHPYQPVYHPDFHQTSIIHASTSKNTFEVPTTSSADYIDLRTNHRSDSITQLSSNLATNSGASAQPEDILGRVDENYVYHYLRSCYWGDFYIDAYDYDQEQLKKLGEAEKERYDGIFDPIELCSVIISREFFVKQSYKIEKERFQFFKKCLKGIFPDLAAELWFSPSYVEFTRAKPAKGYLYAAYRKIRDKASDIEELQLESDDYDGTIDQDFILQWSSSSNKRFKIYKTFDIAEIYKTYEILNSSEAHQLIRSDYQLKNPQPINLNENWSGKVQKILSLARKKESTYIHDLLRKFDAEVAILNSNFEDQENICIDDVIIPSISLEANSYVNNCCRSKVKCLLEQHSNVFDGMLTEKTRFQTYTGTCGFVYPEEFPIGSKNLKRDLNCYDEPPNSELLTATRTPLHDSLKTFLQIPNMLSEIRNYIDALSNEKDIISNFIQGDLWKSKYKNLRDTLLFPLFLFFDDFEPGNALGSHRGQQKLGGVYISFPCVPPHITALINNIFVALLFYSKDREKCGNEAIFMPLINELNQLNSNGLLLELGNEKIRVYFLLTLILGDNLGLNAICGFQKHFNAGHYCRICQLSAKKCWKLNYEIVKSLRTVDSYEKAVQLNCPNKTGVIEECIFNQVHNFHIIDNQSIDLMHDILEGVANFTTCNVLSEIIDDPSNSLTLDILNDRIEDFDFGDLESCRK